MPFVVVIPRMMTFGDAPGEPAVEIWTPLTLPCREFIAFIEGMSTMSSPRMVEIELVRSLFLTTP